MQFLDKETALNAFHHRASTRSYADKKIPAEDFKAILEMGRLSPSSVGSEPWQFLVIQNPELRQKLKPFSWGMITTIESASHIVAILAKKNARFDSPFFADIMDRRGFVGENREKALAKYRQFQVEDIAIADDERALFDWACKQTYIALANMMTGATLIGVDSCPIEGFNYEQANKVLAEAGLFDPNEWAVSVMCTFGYRNKDIKPKARKAFDEVVKFIE